jgi:hypothetical protein
MDCASGGVGGVGGGGGGGVVFLPLIIPKERLIYKHITVRSLYRFQLCRLSLKSY